MAAKRGNLKVEVGDSRDKLIGEGSAATDDKSLKSKSKKRMIVVAGKQGLSKWEGEELETNNNDKGDDRRRRRRIDLGSGSEVIYYPRFLGYQEAWRLFDYLNTHIPWTRPTLRVFGRSCVQPRESCYVASEGLPKLAYSGYEPHPYPWHQFPPLLHLLQEVSDAFPGSGYNSLLLNRYNGGNDYVGWHSDDESLYGPTPQIASLSLGCDRDFFLKEKKKKKKKKNDKAACATSVLEKKCGDEAFCKHQHSLTLKHGSLLLMRGYTQRDWIHSVPKRSKLDAHAVRINLTFRLVL